MWKMTRLQAAQLAEELRALLARIPSDPGTLKDAERKSLRRELAAVSQELHEKLSILDHTKQPESFFDPSDPALFGVFAAIALMGQERVPLGALESNRFYGSGVYAIYYKGTVDYYRPIASSETPIYVGKASPASAVARSPEDQGVKLHVRLNEHRKNIERANNLEIRDFDCRYLVVQTGLQESAENALIGLFHPIWNSETKILYGFGKHGDSGDTRGNDRSPWDVIHPGRAWAVHDKLKDSKTLSQITAEVSNHFNANPPIPDVQHVLASLLAMIKRPR
jgi:hypothetical protein